MADLIRVPQSAEPGGFGQGRADRVIASGRVLLAAVSLVAIWLDPSEPFIYARLAYTLLALYVAYSLVLAVAAWSSRSSSPRLGVVTHVVDLALFSLFLYLTEGPTSPFFVYFTFALVSGTLRWRRRGAIWTAAAALVSFNSLAIFAVVVRHDPDFELNRFIIRSVYLVVITGLLVYYAEYEERGRSEIRALAQWPREQPGDIEPLVAQVLGSAAAVLGAPRLVLHWEDTDEPWEYVALWDHGRVSTEVVSPGTYEPAVVPALAAAAFLCTGRSEPALKLAAVRLESGERDPIHPALRTRFAMDAVLSFPVEGEHFHGRLFALDGPQLTADALVLGKVVCGFVAGSMDHFHLLRRLQLAAAAQERVRLSRDLHDGVLQSLTGAALKLRTAASTLTTAPEATRDRLMEIERVLADEQRELRLLVRQLGPEALEGPVGETSLLDALRDLGLKLEGVWDLHVIFEADLPADRLPRGFVYQVSRIVQEALVNAARHGRASEARVQLAARDGRLELGIKDNGRGFAFQGSYDHAMLRERRLGPVSLKDRVGELGGTLAIESAETGARLDISLLLPVEA